MGNLQLEEVSQEQGGPERDVASTDEERVAQPEGVGCSGEMGDGRHPRARGCGGWSASDHPSGLCLGSPSPQNSPCPWGPRVEGLCPGCDACLCAPFPTVSVPAHSACVPSPRPSDPELSEGRAGLFIHLHPGGLHGSGTLCLSKTTLFPERTIAVWTQGVLGLRRREAVGSHRGL